MRTTHRFAIRAACVGLALLAVRTAGAATPGGALVERLRAWPRANERELLAAFSDLLALPNVASDGPNIERNAAALVARMERLELAPQLLRVESAPPLVVGSWRAPKSKRWVTFYAHYDGQPVDAKQWTSPPFEPVLRSADGKPVAWRDGSGPLDPEARLYARGSGDDKAAVFGLLAAIEALRAAGAAPRVNVRFVFEGEEEAGSPHLAALLERYASAMQTDAWILCDGPVHQSRRPQVFFGARGVVGLEVTVYGPDHGLHSGHYGNWAPDPAVALVHLLAGLRDEEGSITIDGFADDVRPLSLAERQALADVPVVDDALLDELALPRSLGRPETLVRRIQRPALNIHGLEAGHVGPQASNTIQPEARASIDFRLVPDQTLEGVRLAVQRHLERRGWTIVHTAPDRATRRSHERLVRLDWGPGYPAARTPLDAPFARALVATLSAAADGPIIRMPMLGGSIPMYLFQGKDHALPVIGLPIANHDDNQHAPDENLRLQNLWDRITAYAAAMAGLDDADLAPAVGAQ